MSTATLSAMSYSFDIPKPSFDSTHEAVPVSSSSSTCTRESDTFSDVETHHKGLMENNKTPPPKHVDQLNAKVSLRKTSRQGRSSQRWVTEGNETIRLTTGCVPILRGGKILFVSASRKSEWILPKGGWEKDETLEESAIRESFEEAGVLGTLGKKLDDIQYETRKAKKRRLEMEQLVERQKKTKSSSDTDDNKEEVKLPPSDEANETIIPTATVTLSNGAMDRIRGQAEANGPKASDETASNGSTVSAAYSQVRMSLFPLYVSKVLDKWPESGRFRKAVDINEAIDMLESRPELKAALVQVKERGLHLWPGNKATNS